MSHRIASMTFLTAASFLAALSLSLPSFAKENPSKTVDFETRGSESKTITISKGKTDIFVTCYGLDPRQFEESESYMFDITSCKSPAVGVKCTVHHNYEDNEHCICTNDGPKAHSVTVTINNCNYPYQSN